MKIHVRGQVGIDSHCDFKRTPEHATIDQVGGGGQHVYRPKRTIRPTGSFRRLTDPQPSPNLQCGVLTDWHSGVTCKHTSAKLIVITDPARVRPLSSSARTASAGDSNATCKAAMGEVGPPRETN